MKCFCVHQISLYCRPIDILSISGDDTPVSWQTQYWPLHPLRGVYLHHSPLKIPQSSLNILSAALWRESECMYQWFLVYEGSQTHNIREIATSAALHTKLMPQSTQSSSLHLPRFWVHSAAPIVSSSINTRSIVFRLLRYSETLGDTERFDIILNIQIFSSSGFRLCAHPCHKMFTRIQPAKENGRGI